MNKAHEVEYEEAPSGYVTFYNYKEPLMRFEEGHGFVGALVFDGKSDKIQCHLCGQWFDQLGNHLKKEHATTAAQYKERVGLNRTTALVNESFRAKLIANGLKKRMKNLKNQRGAIRSPETRRRISEALKEHRAEQKNLTGTCPEQLIQRLTELHYKLGRTPTDDEITFREALRKTYGTLENACNIAGIPYRKPGQTVSKGKWNPFSAAATVRDYYDETGQLPLITQLPKGLQAWMRRLRNKHQVFRNALTLDGRYRKTKLRIRYTKDELIGFLIKFHEINGRKPSYSDCKRGLLPNLSRYSYNFGSWKKALAAAFPS